ncbi:MAG: SH3 domain-containing protein [Clostridia bacterium]|nr:SH3 domain-containing protein [Clostridia bacterium]
MKKIGLVLFISLLMLSLVFTGIAEDNTPILGPGGENPNSDDSDVPILGPGGENPYSDDSDVPIVGPGGENPNYDPQPIIDPAIHVHMYVQTSGGHLNVRARPETGARIVGRLEYGEEVLVTGYAENRTWAKILYGSSDAYVLARYLSTVLPKPLPTATPYYPPYPYPTEAPYYPTEPPYYPYPTQQPYPYYTESTITDLNNQFSGMALTGSSAYMVNTHPARVGGFVPLYWAPDTGSMVQRYCYEGEGFVVLAYNNTWLQVRDTASGFTGYLMRAFAY